MLRAMTQRSGVQSAQGFRDWLAARSDVQLAELFAARPDLSVPPPQTLTILAERAWLRASVQRAADEVGTFGFLVLAAFGQLAGRSGSLDDILAMCSGRVTEHDALAALQDLSTRALAWEANGVWRVVPGLVELVPWHVARLLVDLPSAAIADVPALLAQLSPEEKGILEVLSGGSPVGKTRDAGRDARPDRPVQQLLAKGLLAWIDDETVELPPHVGQILRGELPLARAVLEEPSLEAPVVPVRTANSAAAGEALELIRHTSMLIEALGVMPAVALRAGGFGVREVKRLNKATGIDEETIAFLVEVLAEAKLIVRGAPEHYEMSELWAPSTAVDSWLGSNPAAKWLVLAEAWLRMRRKPLLIGLRDSNDKAIAALSDEVAAPGAPLERRKIVEALDTGEKLLAPDPSHVHRLLLWRMPRWSRRLTLHTVERTLAEAGTLALTGRGALASAGKALLRGAPGAEVQKLMATALPEPLDHFLVQADLTIIAPGPLVPDLQETVSLVADLESAGAASVYRVTEATALRALDAGYTAAELHALFHNHSRTPVPQALSYLVDDVARRHGQLRAGIAVSFIRCEDPSLVTQVMATPLADSLALRAIAPTVLISQAPLAEVLAGLRGAGFSPAGEDASGAIVDLRPKGTRLPSPQEAYSTARQPTATNTEAVLAMVRAMRSAERALQAQGALGAQTVRANGSRATAAQTMAVVQLAVQSRRNVSIGYIDAQGTASYRIVLPIGVGGGQMEAVEEGAEGVRRFALHRITSITLLD